jgi:hypothetical protein
VGLVEIACAAGGVVAVTADGRLARFAAAGAGPPVSAAQMTMSIAAPHPAAPHDGAHPGHGGHAQHRRGSRGSVSGPVAAVHGLASMMGPGGAGSAAGSASRADPGGKLVDALAATMDAHGDEAAHVVGCGGTVLCSSLSGALYAVSARTRAGRRVQRIVPGTGFAAGPTHCVALTAGVAAAAEAKRSASSRSAQGLSGGEEKKYIYLSNVEKSTSDHNG